MINLQNVTIKGVITSAQAAYARALLDDIYTPAVRFFDDGLLYAAPRRLLFHWTVVLGTIEIESFYMTRWCFQTRKQAMDAAFDPAWDGHGDPAMGWHRHPDTERRFDLSAADPKLATYLQACREAERSDPWNPYTPKVIMGMSGSFEKGMAA